METDLSKSILKIIQSTSEVERKKRMKDTAKYFYFTCVKAGLKREQILSLATEIIGCFTENLECLKQNIEKN